MDYKQQNYRYRLSRTVFFIIIIVYMKKVLPVLVFLFFFFVTKPVSAIKYELVAPTGELEVNQEITFTINIDTEGASVTAGQIGMTYDTTNLQYLTTVPGQAMPGVSISDLGGGKLLFSGTNNNGYTGSGVFATINFKITAQEEGSAQLCVLWAPSTTPTAGPTNTPGPTSTTAPQTTNLPTSGSLTNSLFGTSLALLFFVGAFNLYFLSKNSSFENKPVKKHSPKNKSS